MKTRNPTRSNRQNLSSDGLPPASVRRGSSLKLLVVLGLMLSSLGCEVWIESPVEPVVIVEPQDPPLVYVDTYLDVPAPVLALIEPHVQGYSTPALSRYDEYLYPSNTPYDPYDLPNYVRSDFNGDGFDDYAFLFSDQYWGSDRWQLTTKLLVVLTSPRGLVLSTNLVLGTVSFEPGVRIEEFWALALMPAGEHSISGYRDGVKVVKTVRLYDDGFYLASLDPAEEALFYADGDEVFETDWLNSGLGKKVASAVQGATQTRIIPFHKDVEGRKLPR